MVSSTTALAVAMLLSGQPSLTSAGDTDVIEVVADRKAGDPGALSQVDRDAVTRVGADHPAEVLNQVPGVNIQMNSGQEHLIALRSPVLTAGAGQGSFLILVDGIPTRAPAFGNVNALFEIPYETAAAIEVVRGPGSAQYGSNAVHGIINVIQQTPFDASPLRVQATGLTLSRYRFDATVSGNGNDTGWLLSGSVQDDLGWRDDTSVEQQKLTAQLSTDVGLWDLSGSVFATSLNQETAGFILGEDVYEDDDLIRQNPNPEAYRDAEYVRASLTAKRALGTGELTVIPFAIYQRMEFRQHFLPYKGIETNGQDSAGLLTRYDIRKGRASWSFGADVQWAEGFIRETQPDPFGFFPGDTRFPQGDHYDFTVTTQMAAAFGQLRYDLGADWRMLAGLRAEHHDYDYDTHIPAGIFRRFKVAADREDGFDILTPKLGVVWSGIQDAEFYANYARGQRAPQASDLYRLQSQQEAGEADVESLDSLEAGIRGYWSGPGVNYDIAIYAMHKDNFFFRDADGLNVTDGETDHWGIEGQMVQHREAGLNWKAGFSYGEHRYDFDRQVGTASEVIISGNEVDTAPNWLADLSAGYEFARGSIYADVEYVGEYFTDAANSRDYPGHTLIHLRTEYRLSDELSAFVTVRNLTDEAYADRADFAFGEDRYFPGEPLNAVFGLRLVR